MSRWILLLIGGPLLSVSTSWAASSIGGGILSNDTAGFLSSYPPTYKVANIEENENVEFTASPVFSKGIIINRFVWARLLANEHPRWIGRTDRQEFRDYFLNLGWSAVQHTDPCVEQIEKDNDNTVIRILSWGNGLGAVFIAPSPLKSDVLTFSDSLKLFTGVCSWK